MVDWLSPTAGARTVWRLQKAGSRLDTGHSGQSLPHLLAWADPRCCCGFAEQMLAFRGQHAASTLGGHLETSGSISSVSALDPALLRPQTAFAPARQRLTVCGHWKGLRLVHRGVKSLQGSVRSCRDDGGSEWMCMRRADTHG